MRRLQLPARPRHGDGPRAGLRHGQLGEEGYGDFAIPDLSTLRRIPWLDRTAMVLCDVAWHDGSPMVIAAAGADRPVRARSREELHQQCTTSGSSSTSTTRATPGRTRKTARPDAGDPYILDYHPRHDDGRAVPGPTSPGNAGRRHPGRVLEGRSLVRPARGELPLRRCRHLGGPARSTRTASRRSPSSTTSRRRSWPSRRRRTSAALTMSHLSLFEADKARS